MRFVQTLDLLREELEAAFNTSLLTLDKKCMVCFLTHFKLMLQTALTIKFTVKWSKQ